MQIARTLAEARKAKHLSQKVLAQKLGMRQSQISDIESARRDFRVSTLTEIARAVGLEVILVPRSLLPAVSYVMQSQGTHNEQKAKYEIWNEDEGCDLSE